MRQASLALALLALAACEDRPQQGSVGPKSSAPPAAKAPETPAHEAQALMNDRCAMCHGPTGKGDGPSGLTINPKPRDFTAKEWQKSVTDTQLTAIIVKGGPAVGKSALMPPNPDLEGKPEVVGALVQLVRGYGK